MAKSSFPEYNIFSATVSAKIMKIRAHFPSSLRYGAHKSAPSRILKMFTLRVNNDLSPIGCISRQEFLFSNA